MEAPHSKQRQEYIEAIKKLEAKLKAIADAENTSVESFASVQSELDVLAKKYQDDEKMGSARYKLYEIQAFIYYFEYNDEKALEFIEHAIEQRGDPYEKAESLRNALLSKLADASRQSPALTKKERRKQLVGVEGWLAWFVVGLFLSVIITAYNFFKDGLSIAQSDVDSLNQYQSGLGDSAQALTFFENISIIVYVALIVTSIVLILRRRRFAKTIVIIALAFGAVYGIIDYSITDYLFRAPAFSTYVQPILTQYSGDVSRTVLTALIWIPYFLISRRVKRTLTK